MSEYYIKALKNSIDNKNLKEQSQRHGSNLFLHSTLNCVGRVGDKFGFRLFHALLSASMSPSFALKSSDNSLVRSCERLSSRIRLSVGLLRLFDLHPIGRIA